MTNGRHENGKTAILRTSGIINAAAELYSRTGGYTRAFLVIAAFFALALFLSRGVISQMLAPLGTAFIAAVACTCIRSRALSVSAVLGAIIGYMLPGNAADGLKYAAAAALCFTVGIVLRDSPQLKRRFAPAALSALSLLATNTVYFLSYGVTLKDAALYLCEIVTGMAAAGCYKPLVEKLSRAREAKSERPPNSVLRRDTIQAFGYICGAGASLVLVLGAFPAFLGMNAGRIAAIYMALAVSASDPAPGCVCGLTAGIAASLATGCGTGIALVYALSALTAGAFARFGLLPLTVCFTLCHGALIPWLMPQLGANPVYECFFSGVVFYLSGSAASAAAAKALRMMRRKTDAENRDYALTIEGRLAGTARAFTIAAQDALPPEAPADEGEKDIYALALDRVCRSCTLCSVCHKTGAVLTRNTLDEAKVRILASGRASPEDFPPFFSARCQHLTEFLGAVNEFLALRESRVRYARRARDDALLLGAQYGAIGEFMDELRISVSPQEEDVQEENAALRRALAQADIALGVEVAKRHGRYLCAVKSSIALPERLKRNLEKLASQVLGRVMRFDSDIPSDGEACMHERMAYSVSVAASGCTKEGEDTSGDRCACFKTGNGTVYLVISDGMGSGRGASRESEAFMRMLESFLRTGVSPDTALKLIHPAYTIRCGGDSFTTCDIFSVDLYTGKAASYKCAAAPTYVCPSSGMPRKISSVSLPVGLPLEAPNVDKAGLDLHEGDTVLMMSDGLSDDDERWIYCLLQENRNLPPDALAKTVLEAGEERFGARDDMTVAVMRVQACGKGKN